MHCDLDDMKLGDWFRRRYTGRLSDGQRADVRLTVYKRLIERHGKERVLRHASQIAAALDKLVLGWDERRER